MKASKFRDMTNVELGTKLVDLKNIKGANLLLVNLMTQAKSKA